MVYLVLHPNCIRKPVSLVVSSSFPSSRVRKRGGNNKETNCLFYRVASDIKKKGATSVTNLFVQWVYHIVGMLHFWGVCITVIICGFNFCAWQVP